MGRREGGGRQNVVKDFISKSKPPVGTLYVTMCVLVCVYNEHKHNVAHW